MYKLIHKPLIYECKCGLKYMNLIMYAMLQSYIIKSILLLFIYLFFNLMHYVIIIHICMVFYSLNTFLCYICFYH